VVCAAGKVLTACQKKRKGGTLLMRAQGDMHSLGACASAHDDWSTAKDSLDPD